MITVIGKIELPSDNRKEKQEAKRTSQEILEAIDKGMESSIPLINERLSNFENAPTFLINKEGSINMEAYRDTYGEETITEDYTNSRKQQHAFYQTYDSRNQQRYQITDPELLLEKMKTEERMRDGNISEEALFLLMNKIAGNQFIALRSSLYDDYTHGTDLLLVDTVSGKTICAFDETVEGKNSRLEKKMNRAKERLHNKKGMKIKYGVRFNENSSAMELGAIENIPPLFLAIDKEDLQNLLQIMNFDINTPISEVEKKVMKGMINKIDAQISELESISEGKISYTAVRDFVEVLKSNVEFLEK